MVVSTEVQLYFLEARLPGKPTFICGVLLYDASSDAAVFRIREHWQSSTDADTAEVLGGYKTHFEQLYAELGPKSFVSLLKSELHNVLSLSEEYSLQNPNEDLQDFADKLCGILQTH